MRTFHITRRQILVLLALGCALSAQHVQGADWPQLTGPNGDSTTTASGLADTWPKEGPKLLWEVKVAGSKDKNSGAFSSPVVANGKVFVTARNYELDPDPAVKQFKDSPDILYCLDAADGHELWKLELPLRGPCKPRDRQTIFFKTCWTTPVVEGDFIYARSGSGEMFCVNVKDGKTLWSWPKDAAALEKMTNQGYWTAASSVIVDDLIVFNEYGGGKSKMIALDKKTGEVKWQGKDVRDWIWSGSGLIPMNIGGRKVIVTCNIVVDAMTGENLIKETDSSGKPVNTWGPGSICWISTFKGNQLLTGFTRDSKEPTSGPAGDGKIVPKKVNGIVLIEFSPGENGSVKARTVWESEEPGEAGFENSKTYGGPVIIGDCAYVFIGQNSVKNKLICFNFSDGKQLWHTNLTKHPLAHANVIAADGKLFYIWRGQLTMLAANPKEFQELASAKVIGDGMSSPALAGTKLFLRDDSGTVKCFELAR